MVQTAVAGVTGATLLTSTLLHFHLFVWQFSYDVPHNKEQRKRVNNKNKKAQAHRHADTPTHTHTHSHLHRSDRQISQELKPTDHSDLFIFG